MLQRTRAMRQVPRRSRRLAPAIDRLEGRALLSTAPTTTASIMGQAGANGYYVSPVTIDLTATEPNVTPASLTTMYRVNNGPFTAGNQVVLTEDGTDVVQFFSADASGNVEAPQTLFVKIDTTAPIVTESAQPTTLWPPNHKFSTVTVTGTAIDSVSGINGSRILYSVRDEYGQVQPQGTAVVNADGTYSFNVQLQASRTGQDRDGRQYTIVVRAQNGAGLGATQSTIVTVPHDQGHAGAGGSGSSGGGHRGGKGNPGHGRDQHQGDGHGQGHGNGNGHAKGQGHGNGNGNGNANGQGHGNGNGHGNKHG
ncbi:hypothetical protein SAMN05444166_4053 [Singulisphaera sp. GP187]|uniref:hypothetical protein n=1 Tax=Singulisphaera sp. GP187 TaxID=1882752 RepID=UPI00092801C3|nr:hypothetical protein [Singulisphaera sp. GP187]SIO35652.1 hypothetical protein SAMN05444166_4053 [Singulisphaera sp. GP187]